MSFQIEKKMEVTFSHKLEKICVLCGHSPGRDEMFAEAAIQVGKVLAKNKIQLIYGGGSAGLMGAVATTAYAGGSPVLGVVPRILKPMIGPTIGAEMQTGSIPEQLTVMFNSADSFIVLPGGLGTLESLSFIASCSYLSVHRKPIGVLNVNGYFDPLLSFLDKFVEKGFMFSSVKSIIISDSDIERLLKKLQVSEGLYDVPILQTPTLGKRKRDYDKRGLDLTLSL